MATSLDFLTEIGMANSGEAENAVAAKATRGVTTVRCKSGAGERGSRPDAIVLDSPGTSSAVARVGDACVWAADPGSHSSTSVETGVKRIGAGVSASRAPSDGRRLASSGGRLGARGTETAPGDAGIENSPGKLRSLTLWMVGEVASEVSVDAAFTPASRRSPGSWLVGAATAGPGAISFWIGDVDGNGVGASAAGSILLAGAPASTVGAGADWGA